MRNLVVFLIYEGTAYHGWQIQRPAHGQETLARPWRMWWAVPSMWRAAAAPTPGSMPGATAPIFRTESRIPVDQSLPYALNTHLPPDIVVTGARGGQRGFQCRGVLREKKNIPI